MKERNNYMLCCSCGYAVKDKNIFKKAYQNTAICLCRNAPKSLLKISRIGVIQNVKKQHNNTQS